MRDFLFGAVVKTRIRRKSCYNLIICNWRRGSTPGASFLVAFFSSQTHPMKVKPHTLLLAAGIAALGIYWYLPQPVAPSAPTKLESAKSPRRTSARFTAPAEEAPSRSPEDKPQNPQTVVSRPAPIDKRSGAPVNGAIAALPAGRRSGIAPAPEVDAIVLPAVQLSEKFRLPAGIMAQAMPIPEAGKTQSPQVQAASERIVSQFYQEISQQAALPTVGTDEAVPVEPVMPVEVARSDDPGPATIVVEPDRSTAQIRWNADESYRILFGDESYNQQTIRSAIEVTLPEIR